MKANENCNSGPVDVLAVMAYSAQTFRDLRAASGGVDHALDVEDADLARAAVAELVALARKLRLDREGIENTREKFCAPVLDVADVRAFTAALAQFGGAA